MKTIKIILIFVFISTALVLSCSSKINEKPIRIAINIWPGYSHAFIAKELGYLKDANIELKLFKNISESLKAYRNRQVDGLFHVFPDIILLNMENIETVIFYVADESQSDVIIAKPGIKNLSQLKNKTIGIEGLGTFSHIFIFELLQSVNMNEKDVFFENVKAMDILKALENNQIDAGHTWEPVTSKALKKNYKIISDSTEVSHMIIDVAAVHASVYKKHRCRIRKFVAALKKAEKYLHANPRKASSIVYRYQKIAPKEYLKAVRELKVGRLNADIHEDMKKSGNKIIRYFNKRGMASKEISIKSIIKLNGEK